MTRSDTKNTEYKPRITRIRTDWFACGKKRRGHKMTRSDTKNTEYKPRMTLIRMDWFACGKRGLATKGHKKALKKYRKAGHGWHGYARISIAFGNNGLATKGHKRHEGIQKGRQFKLIPSVGGRFRSACITLCIEEILWALRDIIPYAEKENSWEIAEAKDTIVRIRRH